MRGGVRARGDRVDGLRDDSECSICSLSVSTRWGQRAQGERGRDGGGVRGGMRVGGERGRRVRGCEGGGREGA